MAAPKLMSQSEYARHCGVTPQTIYDRVKHGRITLANKGKKLIDPIRSDKEFSDYTTERFNPESKRLSDGIEGSHLTYAEAKTLKENYAAKTAELDYKVKTKSLVDAKEVEKAAFDVGRKLRDNMLAVPDRVAALVAAETDRHKIHKMITEEITIALNQAL
jgi:hypothetical protein